MGLTDLRLFRAIHLGFFSWESAVEIDGSGGRVASLPLQNTCSHQWGLGKRRSGQIRSHYTLLSSCGVKTRNGHNIYVLESTLHVQSGERRAGHQGPSHSHHMCFHALSIKSEQGYGQPEFCIVRFFLEAGCKWKCRANTISNINFELKILWDYKAISSDALGVAAQWQSICWTYGRLIRGISSNKVLMWKVLRNPCGWETEKSCCLLEKATLTKMAQWSDSM